MTKHAIERRDTHFLDVDLDVYARFPLDHLVAAFGKKVAVYYVGREKRRFGAHLASRMSYGKTAEQVTRELCGVVEQLPRPARRVWNAASERNFNIGIQGGRSPHAHELKISNATLRRVAKLGGSMVVTTYAISQERTPTSRPRRARRR